MVMSSYESELDEADRIIGKQNKEIERLQTALLLAAGELSTYGRHACRHPEEVYDGLLEAADAEGGET